MKENKKRKLMKKNKILKAKQLKFRKFYCKKNLMIQKKDKTSYSNYLI